jgi:hypothetical protein
MYLFSFCADFPVGQAILPAAGFQPARSQPLPLSSSAAIFAFRAQPAKSFLAVDGFHPPAFEVILAAVQHATFTGQLVNKTSHGVLRQLARSAPGLCRNLIELLFQL